MIFTQKDILIKTPIGTQYALNPRNFPSIAISRELRRLLILVDGKHSVGELLSKGLTNIDIDSFNQLTYQGLLVQNALRPNVDTAPTQQTKPQPNKKSFSAIRFEVLDILLNISSQDFNVRPWIDKFEKVYDFDSLINLTLEFHESKLCKKHPQAMQLLDNILP